MQLFVPKEISALETRCALDPASAQKLTNLGIGISVEPGLGDRSGYTDTDYTEAGASLEADRMKGLSEADFVIRVNKPSAEEIAAQKAGAIHMSFLDPFNEPELLDRFSEAKVSAVSLEMMPRTTLAQKMDALSSQANLAGYAAVSLAAEKMLKIFPMMMTPAGTISPAKVFIVGIGVAGLQAIATAKRLGARVTAFDIRPEALEQAESLGARALRIDLGGETSGTDQGYAKELTAEQLEKQRQEQAKVCAQSDVVITTAKVFGRKSPVLIKKDTVDQMSRGSIIIDLAAESGGNVEGTILGKEVVTENGVRIFGYENMEGRVPQVATQMLSANFTNFIEHFWNAEDKALPLDPEDPILAGCLLTKDGQIIHERFKKS